MAGLVTTFGAGAMTNSIGEIRDADFLFVIGSNTSEAHPIIAMEMKLAVHRGATMVVADPRKIFMTTLAEKHLQIKPGSDVWLLNSMAHVIIEEDLVDHDFITNNTENYEAVKAAVKKYSPEAAEEFTGISPEDLRWTARKYATTDRAGIYYTLGITEHSHGTDNVYALANLVLMTGHLGKPSSGMNPLRGQNNVQGANDAGATPIYFPGYQSVVDEEIRKKYEASWGVPLPPKPGLNLNQMMKVLGTEIRGMFILGEDIVLSEPNVAEVEKGLNAMDFLVIQEPFLNETSRFADVIFPSSVFAEKDGVFINSERRVQRVRKAVDPPGEARADWSILLDLAAALGCPFDLEAPKDIYAEMVRDTPQFAGISYERLEDPQPNGLTGIQWPCVSAEDPGTVYLHEGGILRGKGLFTPVEFRPSEEIPDEEYSLVLSTGRTLYHYNAATQTRRDSGLHEKQGEAFIQIHPRDARKRRIEHNEFVDVSTRRGQVTCRAIVSGQVRRGSIWMPLHFSEARANLLTNDAGDPVTQTAEFKVCAAEVVRSKKQDTDLPTPFPGSYFRTPTQH
ncbi:MAG: putative molibdopterin-dependent oxidoreductase YjgC [Glaciecola sp.]